MQAARGVRVPIVVVGAVAEELPMVDGAFDAAVVSLALWELVAVWGYLRFARAVYRLPPAPSRPTARWPGGLVDAVVPGAELAGFAVNYAARIAANAPLSLRGNKRVLRTLETAAGAHDDHAVREPIELGDACFASRNLAEGVRAFAEKREPRWTGE